MKWPTSKNVPKNMIKAHSGSHRNPKETSKESETRLPPTKLPYSKATGPNWLPCWRGERWTPRLLRILSQQHLEEPQSFYGSKGQRSGCLDDRGPITPGVNQTQHSTKRTSCLRSDARVAEQCDVGSGEPEFTQNKSVPGKKMLLDGLINKCDYFRVSVTLCWAVFMHYVHLVQF